MIEMILGDVDKKMSTYLNDSEVSRFNQLRDESWFHISADTFYVIEHALKIANQTAGAFDPTSGALVRLWGFGSVLEPGSVPSRVKVESVKKSVGYQKVELQHGSLQIRKIPPTLELDLSGIAKGYCVDRLATLMESQDIQDFLIEIGGEVRAGGKKPDDTTWKIAIQDPTIPKQALKILTLSDAGLATSGDYRNYFQVDGKRHPHILDPRTGITIDHNLSSVTVIHDSAMYADALATALMVMGPQMAREWAEKNQVAAFFVVVQDGNPHPSYTRAMESYLE